MNRRQFLIRAGTSVAVAVGLGEALNSVDEEAPPRPSHANVMTWDPMARQSVELDTLYLLDADEEESLDFAHFGLIPGNNFKGTIWTPGADVTKAPGRYRAGVQSNNPAFGYAQMRHALPPDEFTIELWVRTIAPWSAYSTYPTLCFIGGITILITQGSLRVDFAHDQDPSGPVRVQMPVPPPQPVPAQTWSSVAVTYQSTTLTAYINGVPRARLTGVKAPKVWPQILTIGGATGVGAVGTVVSDLRISRTARIPARAMPMMGENVLTVMPDRPTGATVQQALLGGLHTLGGTLSERMAAGKIKMLRTDKLLTATPMKAGGPDGGHPAVGHSGMYAYDWQVVDRTFDYLARLGVAAYISIDSTPRLLGGSVAPYTGPALTSSRSYLSQFSPEVPNDMAAFRTIVEDLVYHVIREKRYSVPYWGVWNEPDGTSQFLKGSVADYLRIYHACADAVKAVDPNLKVGGPEIADQFTAARAYVKGLIQFCAQNSVPLDFVSTHNYSGDVASFQDFRTQVDQWTTLFGLRTPMELIVGEWSFSAMWWPGTGYPPYKRYDYVHNDHMAAFMGWALVEMQRVGVVKGVFYLPVADASAKVSSLMGASHPYVGLNVFDMWSRLGSTVLEQSLVADPAMRALSSIDAEGNVSILLANMHFRKGPDQVVTINLPGATAQSRVTHYVIDDRHSNLYDAGLAHAQLETVDPPVARGGAMEITVRSRSVHLLVVARRA